MMSARASAVHRTGFLCELRGRLERGDVHRRPGVVASSRYPETTRVGARFPIDSLPDEHRTDEAAEAILHIEKDVKQLPRGSLCAASVNVALSPPFP